MVTVSIGARLHFGFQNLSLTHERLYGGIGVGLEEPRVTVVADRADRIEAGDSLLEAYGRRVTDLLDVPGISLSLEERLPRHRGLGSGTQLALSTLVATARAYDLDPYLRERAPALGRGGRSGVGTATFESGGFVVDAGHPTEQFTTEPPAEGEWTVPAPVARHDLPESWRVVLVIPDGESGRNGEDEEASIRKVVERADPTVADDIAGIVTRGLLPAAAEGRLDAFGTAVGEIGRKNGIWYTDVQGGVFRPPAGALVDSLRECPALTGVGQSSWGPTVYGFTDDRHGEEARRAGERALDRLGCDGTVLLTSPASSGARVTGQ